MTVDLTLTSIMMIPGPMIDNGAGAADATTSVGHTGTYHLNAIGLDQFGNPTPTQPIFTCKVASGPGTIAWSVLTHSSISGTIEVTASATLSGATSASSGFNIVSGSGPTSTPFNQTAMPSRGTAINHLVFTFQIMLAARTIEESNGSQNMYCVEAPAAWRFDGSGTISGGVWTAGKGSGDFVGSAGSGTSAPLAPAAPGTEVLGMPLTSTTPILNELSNKTRSNRAILENPVNWH